MPFSTLNCSSFFAGRNMSAYRKKRSESLTSESDNRAQKLNKAADRVLCQQITKYEKEEKHLQRELLDLRKTRETLDAGMRLIMPSRARSGSEPLHGLYRERPRCNSGPGFSSHLSGKLPPIMSRSPIPPRRATSLTPDGVACCQDGQAHDASVKENKTCLLSVPEKERLQRTYSANGNLNSRISDKEFKEIPNEESCSAQVLIRKSPLEKETNQDSSPLAEEDIKITPPTDDGVESRRRKLRARSQSDLTKDRFECDPTGSLLSPMLCVPTAPLSPKPRRGSMFSSQSSKTNIDLMHNMKLSGKFKSVGRVALGVAVINRLNVKIPSPVEDLDGGEAGPRSSVSRRRGTMPHINLAPTCSNNNSPTNTRKQKTCWSVKKDDTSQEPDLKQIHNEPDKN